MDKDHKSNIVIVSDLYLQIQFMIQYLCSKSDPEPLEKFLYALRLCDRLDIIKFVLPQATQANHDGFTKWMDGKVSWDKSLGTRITDNISY